MSLTLKQEDVEFELAPQGVHVARCYQVVELGIIQQQNGPYAGKKQHRLRWAFELPNARMESGEPYSVSEQLTASLSSKARLYERLVSWRGKAFTQEELEGFNLKKVVGVPCMINVIHKKSNDGTKTYANIASITPLPQGTQCPDPVNDALFWEYGMDQNLLPDWLQKMLGENPNEPQEPPRSFQEAAAPPPGVPEGYQGVSPNDFDEDSIPF